jgi:hypothetical protein
VNSNLLIFALILGFHLEPAWALLLILIAVIIKLFPAAIVLELFGPAIINAINRNRGNHNGL